MDDRNGQAKTQFVARMFARISRRYDFLNTVMTGGMHHHWRSIVTKLAAHGLHGPALDVATGTGDFALALAKYPTLGEIVGLDLVAEMVALARAKAQRRQLGGRVNFVQGDALCLPFSDNTFGCVTSGFAMRNVADVATAMAEMTRVVRPGGRIAILDILPFETKGVLAKAERCYFQRMVPALGAVLTGDREAYAYLPQSVKGFQSASGLALIMEKVGLRLMHVRTAGMGVVSILIGEKGQ